MAEEFVIRYYVNCRMDVADCWHSLGWCDDEDTLKEFVDKYKKTWRYVDPQAYRSRKINPPESKRKPRKEKS